LAKQVPIARGDAELREKDADTHTEAANLTIIIIIIIIFIIIFITCAQTSGYLQHASPSPDSTD
jgi:O-antigen/teichoic acid export membrane protein